ncbi:hypothetical protein ACFQH6_19960 [Halobacteriaceae archaeon GCM10025711]
MANPKNSPRAYWPGDSSCVASPVGASGGVAGPRPAFIAAMLPTASTTTSTTAPPIPHPISRQTPCSGSHHARRSTPTQRVNPR